jgi:acetyl esterase/lipase
MCATPSSVAARNLSVRATPSPRPRQQRPEQHAEAREAFRARLEATPGAGAARLVEEGTVIRSGGEGEAYGVRLRDAGVELTMHRCAGMHHGFFNYGGVLDGADRAMVQACEWISSLRPAEGARAG